MQSFHHDSISPTYPQLFSFQSEDFYFIFTTKSFMEHNVHQSSGDWIKQLGKIDNILSFFNDWISCAFCKWGFIRWWGKKPLPGLMGVYGFPDFLLFSWPWSCSSIRTFQHVCTCGVSLTLNLGVFWGCATLLSISTFLISDLGQFTNSPHSIQANSINWGNSN